jgi:hypothetical protein
MKLNFALLQSEHKSRGQHVPRVPAPADQATMRISEQTGPGHEAKTSCVPRVPAAANYWRVIFADGRSRAVAVCPAASRVEIQSVIPGAIGAELIDFERAWPEPYG